MITRKEYMAGNATHQAYYGEIAQACHIKLSDSLMARVRASTDPHLNDIPLQTWDIEGSYWHGALRRELQARGDCLSMAGAVCALKAAAIAAK
jgi:hypothetical protein